MKQRASHVMLIRPASFGYNPETAATNDFQHPSSIPVSEKALKEFDSAVYRFRERGLSCLVVDDLSGKILPDSIFPNNWFSTHHDGTLVLYPMLAPSRRAERRSNIEELLYTNLKVRANRKLDLTRLENDGHFLEGTGSMVFDHLNRRVYMAVSPRSSEKVLDQLCHELNYTPVVFRTSTITGLPVYHTNVVMALGTDFALICEDCIHESDRQRVLRELEMSGRKVIGITQEMMAAFGANILEVDRSGEPVILLSETARQSLGRERVRQLEAFGDLIAVNIPTIEKTGGSGVRCMLAEVFLPETGSSFQVKRVTNESDLSKCLQLRWEVLRAPWHQPKGSESDEMDGKVPLTGAFDETGKAVGTGRLQMVDPVTAQIRYMAVDPMWQGKGVGRAVMEELEAYALESGAKEIILQARENALRFYLSNGYEITEKTFLLYGEIQHYMMKKRLK